MNISVSDLSHIFIQSLTDGRGIYIDATAGNGHDTLFWRKRLNKTEIFMRLIYPMKLLKTLKSF
jgi:hypothetical protein